MSISDGKFWITGAWWNPGVDPQEIENQDKVHTFSLGPFDTLEDAEKVANDIPSMEAHLGDIDGTPVEYEVDDWCQMSYNQACKHFEETIMVRHEHVILVGHVVVATSREKAHEYLLTKLPEPERWLSSDVGNFGSEFQAIDSWWVAEDDRRDGPNSDNDSAVFCPGITQETATKILRSVAEWPDSLFRSTFGFDREESNI